MLRKIAILLLISILIFSSFAVAEENGKQTDAANKLKALGLLQGYSDGSLRLERTITRAEFTTLAVRLICKEDLIEQYMTNTIFNDTSEKHWASPYINIAVEEKLIEGYGDGTFRPDNKITYGEVLTLLVRLLGYEDSVNQENPWPLNYVEKAVELGINDELVIPVYLNATRGDVAIFVNSSLTVELRKSY